MKSLLIIGLIVSNAATAHVLECRTTASVSALEQVITTQNFVRLDQLTYNRANSSAIPAGRAEQIRKMVAQTAGFEPTDMLTALHDFDGKSVYRYDFTSQIELPAEFYSVIYGFKNSEIVGVVYEGASLNIVAEIRHNKILICEAN